MLEKNLRTRMSKWILETRLGGDITTASDAREAQRSAVHVFDSANADREGFEAGSRILSAYMVAAAANVTGDARVLDHGTEQSQRVFGYLARKLPAGSVKVELQKAASMDRRTLHSALAAFSGVDTGEK